MLCQAHTITFFEMLYGIIRVLFDLWVLAVMTLILAYDLCTLAAGLALVTGALFPGKNLEKSGYSLTFVSGIVHAQWFAPDPDYQQYEYAPERPTEIMTLTISTSGKTAQPTTAPTSVSQSKFLVFSVTY